MIIKERYMMMKLKSWICLGAVALTSCTIDRGTWHAVRAWPLQCYPRERPDATAGQLYNHGIFYYFRLMSFRIINC